MDSEVDVEEEEEESRETAHEGLGIALAHDDCSYVGPIVSV